MHVLLCFQDRLQIDQVDFQMVILRQRRLYHQCRNELRFDFCFSIRKAACQLGK